MIPLGSQVTEQLNKLGVSPELLQDRIGQLHQAPINALSHLSAAYAQAASKSTSKYSADVNDARVGIAPAWSNPAPMEAMSDRARFIVQNYFRERVPLHPSARKLDDLKQGRRRRGAAMVRRLHRDPAMRKSFEHSTALEVVKDGRLDGTVTVSAMTAGRSATPLSPGLTGNLYSFLGAMDTAVLDYAKQLGVYSSSSPDAFFGSGETLDLYGKGSQYGVSSPSTTGVFGMSGPGTVGGTPTTGDQSSGLDTKIMQLQRMMTKRTEMYDAVRTVFDKYNESARTSINNMKA